MQIQNRSPSAAYSQSISMIISQSNKSLSISITNTKIAQKLSWLCFSLYRLLIHTQKTSSNIFTDHTTMRPIQRNIYAMKVKMTHLAESIHCVSIKNSCTSMRHISQMYTCKAWARGAKASRSEKCRKSCLNFKCKSRMKK